MIFFFLDSQYYIEKDTNNVYTKYKEAKSKDKTVSYCYYRCAHHGCGGEVSMKSNNVIIETKLHCGPHSLQDRRNIEGEAELKRLIRIAGRQLDNGLTHGKAYAVIKNEVQQKYFMKISEDTKNLSKNWFKAAKKSEMRRGNKLY